MENGEAEAAPVHAHPMTAVTGSVTPRNLHHVGEMYGHWFLDYASYRMK